MSPNERKEIMREATRAGVTAETVGEWMNLATRYTRLGKHQDAAHCARQALQIDEVYGSKLDCYAMSPGTKLRALSFANS